MERVLTILAGGCVGLLAALPIVVSLRRRQRSVALGLVALFVSFTLLSVSIVVVRLSQRIPFLPFSLAAIAGCLLPVVAAALYDRR